MKPLKIEKTIVTAKSRDLPASWTFEVAQDLTQVYNIDLDDELSKILAEEVRREQIKEMRERLSWTQVKVKDWRQISDEWCKKYIKHRYQNQGIYWYFEDERDAHFFMLKWVSR